MERKTVGFEIKELDEESGIFEGYAATFSDHPDSYGDIIDPGAFKKSLKEGGKRVKILFNHNVMEPIGKPLQMAEDEKGLKIQGKLSLGVQRAREILALMKDEVITELSIGYDTISEAWDKGIRHLKEIRLWDVSPVTFAANPEAVIVGVKGATTFEDLPLADRDREWDGSAAEKRVRAWAGGADNMNWSKYRRAFLWYDEDNPELFGSYKLGFADIINSRLTAIPRGLFACAVVLKGGRGGVNIPAEDRPKVIAHLNKYYDKMDMESPFKALPGAQEPSDDTPEAMEAAELEGVLEGIKAEINHFDAKRAESRIEELLDKINTEVKTND
jgi:HK97 family phage prohead protease